MYSPVAMLLLLLRLLLLRSAPLCSCFAAESCCCLCTALQRLGSPDETQRVCCLRSRVINTRIHLSTSRGQVAVTADDDQRNKRKKGTAGKAAPGHGDHDCSIDVVEELKEKWAVATAQLADTRELLAAQLREATETTLVSARRAGVEQSITEALKEVHISAGASDQASHAAVEMNSLKEKISHLEADLAIASVLNTKAHRKCSTFEAEVTTQASMLTAQQQVNRKLEEDVKGQARSLESTAEHTTSLQVRKCYR